jgi:enolase-phosphatase E1
VIALGARGVRAVLLDIEGTTTPIAFVHDVLFPFARAHLHEFLSDPRNAGVLGQVVALLSNEHAVDAAGGECPPDWNITTPDETRMSVERYAVWLMDRDRKSPGLKLLQGEIWEGGYRAGFLQSDVYPDVAPAIRRWRAGGMEVAIYSSGSVLAQRLLFASTPDGDLTSTLNGFYDTAVGPKTSAGSYAQIVRAMSRPPREVLFISDVTAELGAARAAGLQVLLSLRPGNAAQPAAGTFETIQSFNEIQD